MTTNAAPQISTRPPVRPESDDPQHAPFLIGLQIEARIEALKRLGAMLNGIIAMTGRACEENEDLPEQGVWTVDSTVRSVIDTLGAEIKALADTGTRLHQIIDGKKAGTAPQPETKDAELSPADLKRAFEEGTGVKVKRGMRVNATGSNREWRDGVVLDVSEKGAFIQAAERDSNDDDIFGALWADVLVFADGPEE